MKTNKLYFFFAGVLAALASVFFEALYGILTYEEYAAPGRYSFFLSAALIEEVMIALMVWKILGPSKDAKNIWLKSFLVGSGFSFVEILLNSFKHTEIGPLIVPYLGLFLVHITTALLFAYFFSATRRSIFGMGLTFLFAIALHLMYNFSVLSDVRMMEAQLILGSVYLTFIYLTLKRRTFLPTRDN